MNIHHNNSMNKPVNWLAFVSSLSPRNVAQRMRLMRNLESLGCAVLREGVYLLPDTPVNAQALKYQVEYVTNSGGSAQVLQVSNSDPEQAETFRKMFDRSSDYEEVSKAARSLKAGYGISEPSAIARVLHKLRGDFEAICATDFFPGSAREEVEKALLEAETEVNALLFPGDKGAGKIRRHNRDDYTQRLWATRRGLGADRLASAWLIRRFVDPLARFVWLDKNQTGPRDAISFAFDGAAFNNAGDRVTFEVLTASFGLDTMPALQRMGKLVHYLEAGGKPVAEASGVETLLESAKRRSKGEDLLLNQAAKTFDLILDAYVKEPVPE